MTGTQYSVLYLISFTVPACFGQVMGYNTKMHSVSFFFAYFAWHYGRAFKDLLNVWSNFLWFLFHFFSIPLLLRTFFSPFKRVTEEHTRAGLEDLLGTIAVNIVSRVVGALARFFILLIGSFVLIVWVVALVLLLAFWILAPILLVHALLYGFSLLLL